jgi:hypothetical protein
MLLTQILLFNQKNAVIFAGIAPGSISCPQLKNYLQENS